MRLFVAVSPGPEALAKLRDMLQHLRGKYPKLRWVDARQAHLTLAFLGEVGEDRVEAVQQAMQVSVKNMRPFQLAFGSSGAFPGWSSPRVLWLGVERGGDSLSALEASLRGQLVSRGFSLEKRPYHPHLTLCRSGSGKNWEGLRPELEGLAQPERWKDCAAKVEGLELVSSRLTPEGPAYSALHAQKFAGA